MNTSRLIKGPVRAYKKIAEIERQLQQQQQQQESTADQPPMQSSTGLSQEFVLRGSAIRINEIYSAKSYSSRGDLTTAKSSQSLARQKSKSKSLNGGDNGGQQLHVKIDADYMIDDFANPKNINEFMNMLHLSPVPLE